MANEWVERHQGYEVDRPLSHRLRVVQDRLREALDTCPLGPARILSLCAGDGRDLLGVLSTPPRAQEVRARLIERTPELVAAGRERAFRDGLSTVEFVQADASSTDAYLGAVPAETVLVCGIFGNISDRDDRCTVDHLPELSAENGTVIWTRGRFEPDLTPAIREWFVEAGYRERSFVTIPGTTMSVGTHRLEVPPRPLRRERKPFTFLSKDERPSTRAGSPTNSPARALRP